MQKEEPKQRYDFAYWFNELVAAGKKIEPDKYTTSYIDKMRKAWQGQPITKLHLLTVKRKEEANQQTLNL